MDEGVSLMKSGNQPRGGSCVYGQPVRAAEGAGDE
jgi:hypothetical protein